MDLGFGSLIEKLEEYFGRSATWAFLSLVALTIIVYCMMALYKAISSISTYSIAWLVVHCVALSIFVAAMKNYIANTHAQMMVKIDDFEKKSKARKKENDEIFKENQKMIAEHERRNMQVQKDIQRLSERASEIERKFRMNEP